MTPEERAERLAILIEVSWWGVRGHAPKIDLAKTIAVEIRAAVEEAKGVK